MPGGRASLLGPPLGSNDGLVVAPFVGQLGRFLGQVGGFFRPLGSLLGPLGPLGPLASLLGQVACVLRQLASLVGLLLGTGRGVTVIRLSGQAAVGHAVALVVTQA